MDRLAKKFRREFRIQANIALINLLAFYPNSSLSVLRKWLCAIGLVI